jgi:hypothetical protein
MQPSFSSLRFLRFNVFTAKFAEVFEEDRREKLIKK